MLIYLNMYIGIGFLIVCLIVFQNCVCKYKSRVRFRLSLILLYWLLIFLTDCILFETLFDILRLSGITRLWKSEFYRIIIIRSDYDNVMYI